MIAQALPASEPGCSGVTSVTEPGPEQGQNRMKPASHQPLHTASSLFKTPGG